MSRALKVLPGAGVTVTVRLFGNVPSKKNNRGISRTGRVYVRDNDRAAMDSLIFQARSQWTGAPAVRPSLKVQFIVRDGRADLDNKWTTVQDCLVKAGVLKNDSIAQLCGPITLQARIEDVEEERVEIEVIQ